MYRVPAPRPLPVFVLRSSASVTLTLLAFGVPTLLLGVILPLDTLFRDPDASSAQGMISALCAVVLACVLWIALDRWPKRISFTRDSNTVIGEWRRATRLLSAHRLVHADIVDVVLQKANTTVDHAGDFDLVLRTRDAQIPLGFIASVTACETKALELMAFFEST